jgi:hypothetical protein
VKRFFQLVILNLRRDERDLVSVYLLSMHLWGDTTAVYPLKAVFRMITPKDPSLTLS